MEDMETSQETAELNETPQESGSFFSGLSDEYRENPALQSFKDADNNAIAKAFIDTKSLVGREKVPLPKEGDADDQTRFWTAIGKPAESNLYSDPDVKPVDGLDINMDVLKGMAHKANLTDSQFKAMAGDYIEELNNLAKQRSDEINAKNAKFETELRGQLGERFEEYKNLSVKLMDNYAKDSEQREWLEQALNHPFGLRFLGDIGTKFSEHSLGENYGSSLHETPADAQAKINKLRNDLNSDYYNDDISIRQPAIDEVERLTKIVMGMK